MRASKTVRHILTGLALAVLAALWPGAAYAACTVSAGAANAGSLYGSALQTSAPAEAKGTAGFSCANTVLNLFGGNVVSAKFTSANNFVLKPVSGAGSVTYTASAQANGATPITQNATIDYMQNNLLNLLGLLGSSTASVPIYVKAASPGTLLPVGTYTDTITATWTWKICSVAYVAGACVGTLDQGTGKAAAITVTLTVVPEGVRTTITSVTTWDPVSNTTNPKALPGSKRRYTITLTNPNGSALDNNLLSIVVPTPPDCIVALDGDGTGSAVIQSSAGSSALTLTYAGATASGDDVYFSTDSGTPTNFTYQPATQDGAVTAVQFKPQGMMAAGSTFSVSLPYIMH